jgi:hypothetical protein
MSKSPYIEMARKATDISPKIRNVAIVQFVSAALIAWLVGDTEALAVVLSGIPTLIAGYLATDKVKVPTDQVIDEINPEIVQYPDA